MIYIIIIVLRIFETYSVFCKLILERANFDGSSTKNRSKYLPNLLFSLSEQLPG